MTTLELPTVLVLGRDRVGVIAESDGMRYYLTDCCGASAKGMSNYVGCRACYQPIDPQLGGVPDQVLTIVDGSVEFQPRPIEWVEVFGDGISYDAWKASR